MECEALEGSAMTAKEAKNGRLQLNATHTLAGRTHGIGVTHLESTNNIEQKNTMTTIPIVDITVMLSKS